MDHPSRGGTLQWRLQFRKVKRHDGTEFDVHLVPELFGIFGIAVEVLASQASQNLQLRVICNLAHK
jgi:hypothetical protein